MLHSFFSWVYSHPGVFIFLGALFTALGGVLALNQQNRSADELRAKSDEIADLNRKLTSSMTGGDSFCYIKPFIDEDKPNTVSLLLLHKGEFPVYDIEIRMADLSHLNPPDRARQFGNVAQADLRVPQVRTLGPGQRREIDTWTVPGGVAYQSYDVFIGARNGFFIQNIRLHRINERWRSAVRIFKAMDKEQTLLLEEVDPEFPRNKGGQIEW